MFYSVQKLSEHPVLQKYTKHSHSLYVISVRLSAVCHNVYILDKGLNNKLIKYEVP
jgi:hypothetical protein